jgi:hypothetical protein
VVAGTFKRIKVLFDRTFVPPKTDADPCAGIAAFADEKVKAVLIDLSCHMGRVVDVASHLVDEKTCQGYGRPAGRPATATQQSS